LLRTCISNFFVRLGSVSLAYDTHEFQAYILSILTTFAVIVAETATSSTEAFSKQIFKFF